MSPHHSPIRGGPSDALERRDLAAGGQAGFADRVRSSAAHVVWWSRTAAPVRAPDRAAAPTEGRMRSAWRRLRRCATRPAAPRAALRPRPAAGAPAVLWERSAPAPPRGAGARPRRADRGPPAPALHARDATAGDPAPPRPPA